MSSKPWWRLAAGAGVYPVLEALGIDDGVSPATRSQLALSMAQADIALLAAALEQACPVHWPACAPDAIPGRAVTGLARPDGAEWTWNLIDTIRQVSIR